MSERNYFNIRNSLPGFTFLLIVILLNIFPLLHYFNESDLDVGIVFSILSLFIAQSFGFLVGQMWWRYFQYKNIQFFNDEHNPKISMQYIIDNFYDRIDNFNNRRDDRIQYIISTYDYVAHYLLSKKKYNEVVKYTTRRWDLFHTLNITLRAIYTAILIGFVVRVLLMPVYFIDYSAVSSCRLLG